MARKRTMNRMAMRSEFDEEERQTEEEEEKDDDEDEDEDGDDEDEEGGDDDEPAEGGEDDEEAEVKPKKKPKKKPTPVKAPAKPRARASKVVRMKVVWGVFNNSNQQLEIFPFPDKADADAKAAKLTADKKATHFVQPVKQPLEEKEKDDGKETKEKEKKK